MTDAPLPAAALRQKREQTIARLCEHFAQDDLEAEELEALIDRAHRAQTLAELDALVAPLPAARPATPPAPREELAPAGRRGRPQNFVLAVMGGAERKGAWTPAREINVVAVMGGVMLDFRDARLDPGVTELRVLALMGGVEIIVPPDVEVDSSGIGIMGGFEHAGHGRFPVDLRRPVLRITGLAMMGGVEITVRHPGETARDARLRRKAERRALRDQHRHRLERGEPRDGSGWPGSPG